MLLKCKCRTKCLERGMQTQGLPSILYTWVWKAAGDSTVRNLRTKRHRGWEHYRTGGVGRLAWRQLPQSKKIWATVLRDASRHLPHSPPPFGFLETAAPERWDWRCAPPPTAHNQILMRFLITSLDLTSICTNAVWGKISVLILCTVVCLRGAVCKLNKGTLLWWHVGEEVPSTVSTHQDMHPKLCLSERAHSPWSASGPPLGQRKYCVCIVFLTLRLGPTRQAIIQLLQWFLLPNPAEINSHCSAESDPSNCCLLERHPLCLFCPPCSQPPLHLQAIAWALASAFSCPSTLTRWSLPSSV